MRKAQGYVLPNIPLAKSNLVGLARGPYPAHSLSLLFYWAGLRSAIRAGLDPAAHASYWHNASNSAADRSMRARGERVN